MSNTPATTDPSVDAFAAAVATDAGDRPKPFAAFTVKV